jgi:SAM-dependent methyltransferase
VRKDYVEVTSASNAEAAFVEEFWARHWQDRTPPPATTVVNRDDYKVIRPFLDRLPAGSRVLDAGCGLGAWTVFLTDRGFDAVGMDISVRTISTLHAVLPDHQFVVGDVRSTGLPDRMFDACMAWGTFEHFENGLGDCLREAYRVLKPDGWLFISVPFHNWRHIVRDARARPRPRHDGPSRPPHRFYQWRLTIGELHQEVELRGFRVVTIVPTEKIEGVDRWLRSSLAFPAPGGLTFRLLRRALATLLPASVVSHMIVAVAQKPNSG